jgi:hypothetical protein
MFKKNFTVLQYVCLSLHKNCFLRSLLKIFSNKFTLNREKLKHLLYLFFPTKLDLLVICCINIISWLGRETNTLLWYWQTLNSKIWVHSCHSFIQWPMAHYNGAGVFTGRGLKDWLLLQCLLLIVFFFFIIIKL